MAAKGKSVLRLEHGADEARVGWKIRFASSAFVEGGCKAPVDKDGDKSGAAAFKVNSRSGGESSAGAKRPWSAALAEPLS